MILDVFIEECFTCKEPHRTQLMRLPMSAHWSYICSTKGTTVILDPDDLGRIHAIIPISEGVPDPCKLLESVGHEEAAATLRTNLGLIDGIQKMLESLPRYDVNFEGRLFKDPYGEVVKHDDLLPMLKR